MVRTLGSHASHADAGEGCNVVSEGWHLDGPRVSGPWLGVLGGNANALLHPSSHTYIFPSFLPCGTMFPHVFTMQPTWHHDGRRMISRCVHRVDASTPDQDILHVR